MNACPKRFAVVPRFLAATALAVLPVISAKAGQPLQQPTPAKLTATSCGDFGFDLYRQLVGSLSQFRSPNDGNLAFSPYCLVLSLEALRQGTTGQAADEIAKALHTADDIPGAHELLDPTKLNAAGTQNPVSVGNGIWVDQRFPLNPMFAKNATSVLGGKVANADLSSPDAAAAAINSWLSTATEKRIPQAFTPADLQKSTMAVANTIAFKGFWQEKFDETQTRPGPFHLTSGKTIQVPLMHQVGTYGFADLGWVKVLELPYQGGTLAMDILLPVPKPGGLGRVERSVTELWYNDLTNHIGQRKLEIAVPKFTVPCDMGDTIAMLRAQGIRQVFSPPTATSSELAFASKPVVPNVWRHKTWVSVDEEGTAALAAVAEEPGSQKSAIKPANFTADHPFLFVIRHIPTGTPLFMGRISKP